MRNKFRFLFLMLFTVICTVSLSAQEGGKKQRDPVVINWWVVETYGAGDVSGTDLKRRIIDDFEAANPGIRIKMTIFRDYNQLSMKALDSANAGDPPDLFYSYGDSLLTDSAGMGMLKDITQFIEETLSGKIAGAAFDLFKVNGKYYGFPYDLGSVVFWYNKNIFRECGITAPETFNDLLSIIPVIRENGYIPISLGAGDRWPVLFWWSYLAMRIGGEKALADALSGAGSFRNQAFVKAGEKMLELASLDPFQDNYLSSGYYEEFELMGNGSAAMELMGQWAENIYETGSIEGDAGGEIFGIFPFPAVEGGAGSARDLMGGGNGYLAGKNAPDEIYKFIDFMLSAEYQTEQAEIEGILPVVKGSESAVSGNLAEIIEMIRNSEYFQAYLDQKLSYTAREVLTQAIFDLLSGTISAKDMTAAVDSALQNE